MVIDAWGNLEAMRASTTAPANTSTSAMATTSTTTAKQPKSRASQVAPTPSQAKEQLKHAEQHAFPKEVIQYLTDEVERLKAEEVATRPIGQRIDAARARLNRAMDKVEATTALHNELKKQLEEEQAEVADAHSELIEIMTATKQKERDTPQTVKLLRELVVAIESAWLPKEAGQPPENLLKAMQEATNAILQDEEQNDESDEDKPEPIVVDSDMIVEKRPPEKEDTASESKPDTATWPTVQEAAARTKSRSNSPMQGLIVRPRPDTGVPSADDLQETLKRARRMVPGVI